MRKTEKDIIEPKPFRVDSLERLFRRERNKKRNYKSPDWLFHGTKQQCLEYIARKAEKHGSKILDELIINRKEGGEIKWKTNELPLLSKRKITKETNSTSAQSGDVLSAASSRARDSKTALQDDVMQKMPNVTTAKNKIKS